MRLPNGYGSVIKLGGKRRKPYAVRITTDYKQNDAGEYVQKYKYLEYFEKSKDAYAYLAEYNAGVKVKEHVPLSNLPTFAEVYNMWLDFKFSLKKKPAAGTYSNYKAAFKNLEPLHSIKFKNIRLSDLQEVVSRYKDMSSGTNAAIMTVLHGMYKYAMRYEFVEKDYSQLVTVEWENPSEPSHVPFLKSEVEYLWQHKDEENVFVVLIMIYTGVRASEFLTLKTENIHIDKRYMIGGMKTDAGINRIIPINEKIVPLLESHYNTENEYFYPRNDGRAYSFVAFYRANWKNVMAAMNMEHKPHDTRHTCATLLEEAKVSDFHRKLILGHAVDDITNGVYTHVSTETLIEDINQI